MPFGFGRRHVPEAPSFVFPRFETAIPRDPSLNAPTSWTADTTRRLLGVDVPSFTSFMTLHAGATFAGGALRVLGNATDPTITAFNSPRAGWHSDWPSMPSGKVFATDWHGNLWLLGPSRFTTGEPVVSLLEVAAAEYVALDVDSLGFVDRVLPDGARELLALDQREAWHESGGRDPGPDECVAYTFPLILGGEDAPGNMEVFYLGVWVSMSGQIHEQTKDLPEGATITGFEFRQ